MFAINIISHSGYLYLLTSYIQKSFSYLKDSLSSILYTKTTALAPR